MGVGAVRLRWGVADRAHHRCMDAVADKATSVVVATDGSIYATAAVDWAAGEALSRRAPLVIVTACPPGEVPLASEAEPLSETVMTSLLDEARLRAKEHQEIVLVAADRVRKHYPNLVVTTEVFQGDPRKALELYEGLASLIVVGSRGLGSIRSVLLGSVSFWATRHLTVPFVAVRPSDGERLSVPHRVAVGIGSAADADVTLRAAFEMAARRRCPLTIANAAWDEHAVGHTWKVLSVDEVEPQRSRAVTDLAAQVAADFPGVEYSVMFASGRVDYFLASLGHSHEALVLGRRQSTFLDFVSLGTLATFVIEHGVGATMVVPVEGERQ